MPHVLVSVLGDQQHPPHHHSSIIDRQTMLLQGIKEANETNFLKFISTALVPNNILNKE